MDAEGVGVLLGGGCDDCLQLFFLLFQANPDALFRTIGDFSAPVFARPVVRLARLFLTVTSP